MKKIFLTQKGTHKGSPISVQRIRKRMQYYARISGLTMSCYLLRHAITTQMLNADAGLVSIHDLLGPCRIKATQR